MTNRPASRFNLILHVLNPDYSTKMDHLNGKHPETRTTVKAMPMSGIRREADFDTITLLTDHAVDGHNQANQ